VSVQVYEMCVCSCVYLCVHVCVSACLYVYVSVKSCARVGISCIFERLYTYVYEYCSECPYLSVFLCVSMSVYLVVNVSICVCRCVSV